MYNTNRKMEYLLIAFVFVLLDSIYLSLVNNYFNQQIKRIQGSSIQINYVAALITYVFLVYGLYHFIIQPKRSPMEAALLGFVIYGVYEFTNLSIIKNWKWFTALIDTAWGTTLFWLTTTIYYQLKRFV